MCTGEFGLQLDRCGQKGKCLGEESEARFFRKGRIWMGSMNLLVNLKHCIETRASAQTNSARCSTISKEAPEF